MNTKLFVYHTNNGGIMSKKSIILGMFFIIILIRLFYLNIIDGDKYKTLLDKKVNNYVYGETAPRGRILDRNGVILVDNIGVKTVFYSKLGGISTDEEINIAYQLANILDIEVNEGSLKTFWLLKNDNGKSLITEEEYDLYERRKLTNNDLKNLKYGRITDEHIQMLNDLDKKSATIYELMNKGYSYEKKVIVKEISDEEYSKIVDANIKGVTTELTWDRVYNYGDTLKDIYGTLGNIPEEKKSEYLEKGYELNDIVGLSYLELQYEEYLKGEKDLYKVNKDNTLTLIEEGKRGNDLVLSIDIEVQLKLEEVIRENIVKAKKRDNTDYFSETYAIIGDPNTGEIIAMSGQKLISDIATSKFKNINTNLINTSYTVGSVVKMGTISTGYKYGVIDIGSSVTDSCIKLYQVPIKCSYKSLGRINDLTAISKSSNYYQFKIAIGLTNNNYKYNMKLDTTKADFEKFRNVFREYGLGMITGIDLPNETTGIIGSLTQSDLLLNLSIGQYDTYTPIELFQYVNTIANSGLKRSPQLMKEINYNDKIIASNNYKIISKVNLDDKYLTRIKEAMHLATTSGTARNYINSKYNPAGKTGTSETFIDTNNDGVMDTKTTSIAFVGFAPFDEPEYSIVVLSPNIYVSKEYEYSKVYITRYISRDITNFLFENQ
ncbi:MAG: penicillin-binding protein 2 [Firmicutes bacterium]|nr:penicillin-binding protein 2 [Bacillota bacterium]